MSDKTGLIFFLFSFFFSAGHVIRKICQAQTIFIVNSGIEVTQQAVKLDQTVPPSL